jgi:hypothetical protein
VAGTTGNQEKSPLKEKGSQSGKYFQVFWKHTRYLHHYGFLWLPSYGAPSPMTAILAISVLWLPFSNSQIHSKIR